MQLLNEAKVINGIHNNSASRCLTDINVFMPDTALDNTACNLKTIASKTFKYHKQNVIFQR